MSEILNVKPGEIVEINAGETVEMRTMKALTIIQPWATLLASGIKKCETRSWKTNYRGEILIHAGKKIATKEMMPAEIWKIASEHLEDREISSELPLGAIIGRATLVDCVKIDLLGLGVVMQEHPTEYLFGDFTPGRYSWIMKDPVLFDKPIPAKGKQGLWNFEAVVKI